MTPVIISRGPIPRIEVARDKQDWFEAIVLSAIYLERYSYLTVKEHLNSLEVGYRHDDLVRMHLPEMALMLLIVKKVDEKDYLKILEINSIRNKFLHRRDNYKFKPTIGPKAKEEYEPLVNEAIRILSEKLDAVRGKASL